MPKVGMQPIRKRQLIEATIDLAIREGLAAASVRRIADEANVSLGVVHYCFSSKEALLNAVAVLVIAAVHTGWVERVRLRTLIASATIAAAVFAVALALRVGVAQVAHPRVAAVGERRVEVGDQRARAQPLRGGRAGLAMRRARTPAAATGAAGPGGR